MLPLTTLLFRALTLLENGLLYESQEDLKSKMKYFFSFGVQFLMKQVKPVFISQNSRFLLKVTYLFPLFGFQNLLSSDGKLNVDATFITHLHYHEPANFAFYFLLNSGVLGKICNRITETSLQTLVIILNFLFGRIPVTRKQIDTKKSNSVVRLPPLPKEVIKVMIRNLHCKVYPAY